MGSIQAVFKRNFLTGLVVSIPAIITIFVIIWFFDVIDGIMAPFYDKLLGHHVAGLGFVSTILIIYIVGMVSRNVMGRRFIAMLENLFQRIPLIKSIYSSVKQILDAFSPDSKKGSFQKFVIVEHPREGTFAFGFLTKQCSIGRGGTESTLCTVFIPTNNLYLGDIVLFKDEDIYYTDIPVDEGVKIILSGGIAAPEKIREGNR